MEPSFWHQRWQNNEIGFHESRPNAFLLTHFHELSVAKGRRIFLPLCGKTLDFGWLLSKGYRVAGAEISQIAIEQLFMQLGLQPEISEVGDVHQWSAKNIDIFVGDLFALTRKSLGPVDAVYDRAALVALSEPMRGRYTAHLREITAAPPQLLISYEYDQRAISGPPFSVSKDEVFRHYSDTYELTLLASREVVGGLKGKCPATEHVWRLRPRRG